MMIVLINLRIRVYDFAVGNGNTATGLGICITFIKLTLLRIQKMFVKKYGINTFIMLVDAYFV